MSRPNNRPDPVLDPVLDHRLDEELRNAFRREQPSADFTMRVLERVSREPLPHLRWWQKLALLLDPPKLRWVAIGVTASLLLAIGAVQYSRLHQGVVNDSVTFATGDQSQDGTRKEAVESGTVPLRQEAAIETPKPAPSKRAASSSTNQRLALARHREQRELRAEGEAAKEKLMLALAIASSALSDAQKAVHDDGVQP
jgi:hypothetical protein